MRKINVNVITGSKWYTLRQGRDSLFTAIFFFWGMTDMRKTLLTAVFVALPFHCPVHAGIEEARNAYQHGEYVSALSEWQKLAAQDNAEAQYTMGVMYDEGQGVAADPAEGLKWYRKAAAQGFEAAQYALGVKYLKGQGTPRDEDEALKWFTPLMEPKASPPALSPYAHLVTYELGASYVDSSDHAATSYARTFPWFVKVAGQGNPFAQYYLGVMYEQGLGTAQNSSEAARWFHQAAASGVAAAQKDLALLYQQGRGVKQNDIAAYALFELAAASSLLSAQEEKAIVENRRSMQEKLSADQIRAGHELARSMAQSGNFSKALQQYLHNG